MQPSLVFTLLLLSLTILATPIPETFPEAVPEVSAVTPRSTEEGDPALSAVPEIGHLFKRSYQTCNIIGAPEWVSCGPGPNTSHAAKWVVKHGGLYGFQCYEEGECFEGNW
jgi:hypothetical protein